MNSRPGVSFTPPPGLKVSDLPVAAQEFLQATTDDQQLAALGAGTAGKAVLAAETEAEGRAAIDALCEITDVATWDDFTSGKAHVYTNGGATFQIVNSVKTNVTVINVGSAALVLEDVDVTDSITINPGEIVNFTTVEVVAEFEYTFTENSRAMIDQMALPKAGGTVTGDIALPNATSGANNALSRAVADLLYLRHQTSALISAASVPMSDAVLSTVSGGSSNRSVGQVGMSVDATLGAEAHARLWYAGQGINTGSSALSGGLDTTLPWSFVFRIGSSGYSGSSANTSARIVVGGTNNPDFPASEKSMGIEFVVGATSIVQARLWYHDGTDATFGTTTSMTGVTAFTSPHTWILSSNGTTMRAQVLVGNANPSSTANVTELALAVSGTIDANIWASIINNGVTGSTSGVMRLNGSVSVLPYALL